MPQELFKIQEQELAHLLNGIGESVNGKIADKHTGEGITWARFFGTKHPYEEIKWVIREAKITRGNGEVVFQQSNVEAPEDWSQTAVDIVASKYFRGKLDSPNRERSVRQMTDRVADTVCQWGFRDGYFKTQQDYENFKNDLKYLIVNQYATFNSPVWFNVGSDPVPQCSACFILSVEDTMESILEWYNSEGWIFKRGSGSGVNLSKLRSSKEPLSRGGYSSGPVSFMKGADGVANSIRSGGTTRRAAKMVVLDADHPDINDFIYCKKNIEEMTKILEASGIRNSVAAELFDPYTLLPYQNANNSVRVTDEFMSKVENDEMWDLKARASDRIIETIKARDLMNWVSDAAWHSADPGIQFDTTINVWNTCPNFGRINASNPCSEYMHIDNSACNLASLNLLKFLNPDGTFEVQKFKKAVDIMITCQEIIVGNSFYPTEKITANAKSFRQLGLGYANLGALLMNLGYPYDSQEGRSIAAAVTSVMTGEAYLTSAILSKNKGPFLYFESNREPMLGVIRKHGLAAENMAANFTVRGFNELLDEATNIWKQVYEEGGKYGFRNSQTTLLAPTGTTGFMMDCQTLGIEPELAIIKYKKLVGGGVLKLVNNQVPVALQRLGYDDQQIKDITSYILEKEMIEGAPHIKQEHLAIFDCSFKANTGKRSIGYLGHIKMMGAAQPFLSGAISKTVNLPAEATVDDIREVFMQSWKLGLKAVAVYRDGCKSIQPLNTTKEDSKFVERTSTGYMRIKMPDERPALTHKFYIGGHKGYLNIGMYPNTKRPGEIFITIAKEGSTMSGLLDTIATLTSICLQSGVPLKTLVRKFMDRRFEPSGLTANEQIPFAKSFIDYIFRYLGHKFLTEKEKEVIFGPPHDHAKGSAIPEDMNGDIKQVPTETEKATAAETKEENPARTRLMMEISAPTAAVNGTIVSRSSDPDSLWEDGDRDAHTDAPLCDCGTIMIRAGSCYTCPNCFATTGVCN
ncbi:MAG: ribonucleoside-diphosphate reductase alpha chain [Parcubacteria group bacterium Licking1014_17]|nr:MAG: ribonucleoside-diphosphate reductase alpha chain [Parcubacteria group bacterium Licking1014_17]